MLKQFKKFKRLILTSTLKPKAFLILFVLFFSTLVYAASTTVTWIDGRIPPGKGVSTTCKSFDGDLLNSDSTEEPTDVAFSSDGLKVFTTNKLQQQLRSVGNLSMNVLNTPFDVASVKTDGGCTDLNAFRINNASTLHSRLRNLMIVDNGKKFFIGDLNGKVGRFDLSTPNDFTTHTFVNEISFPSDELNFAFSTDGTKIYSVNTATIESPIVTTYQLPGPFDISSKTQIHDVNLTTLGVELFDGKDKARDIEFSVTGNAMFVMMTNYEANGGEASTFQDQFIYQFTLSKNFDVSTATLVGRYQTNDFKNRTDTSPEPNGFVFSGDGMRLFIVEERDGAGVDQINSYQLECPYGLVQCVSNTSSSIESQVELAKQNISLNVDTIFKRFEWIKRNRDNENLSAHNFNINYHDPLIQTLANKFEPSVKNNVATFISKHKSKDKKSKWSSWSLADISLRIFGQDGTVKAKDVNTRGLTIGADRKFGNNKFLGWAIRYSDGSSDIKLSKQDLTMESLTLNLYGISPSKDNQYINAVIGLSHLRFDHRYMGNLSGERKGKQAFASINYRTKDKYGILNVTPTGKLTYGVTRLSEFTDFLSKASGLSSQDVRYKKDTFVSGEFAGGFLFETDIIETDQGTVQPMGGIEILYDLTNDIDYKYMIQGETSVGKETIHSPFSRQNLKTSIGFEAVHLNGFTVSADYQRLIRLNDTKNAPEYQTETFILKFSRSKEEDNQFALNYDPINAHQTNLSYSKNIHGLDFKINSNQSLENSSEYFTNLEVSGKF